MPSSRRSAIRPALTQSEPRTRSNGSGRASRRRLSKHLPGRPASGCERRASAIAATTSTRSLSASKSARKKFASSGRKAYCCDPGRRFKHKNGGFWCYQFCTEVARPTRFEVVTSAFGRQSVLSFERHSLPSSNSRPVVPTLSLPTKRRRSERSLRDTEDDNLLGPNVKTSETLQLSCDLLTAFKVGLGVSCHAPWVAKLPSILPGQRFGNRPESLGFTWLVKWLISKTR